LYNTQEGQLLKTNHESVFVRKEEEMAALNSGQFPGILNPAEYLNMAK